MRRDLHRGLTAALVLAAVSMPSSGCGIGLLQSARTTPAGEIDLSVGGGYVYNGMIEKRGYAVGNFPPQVGLRFGVSDQLDVGLSMFAGLGGLVDAKYSLVPNDSPLAVSLLGGFGAAFDASDAVVLHAPLRLLASIDLAGGLLTPYVGAGYGFFWVFGYGHPEPGVRYAARAGHGDGLLMLTAGTQVWSRGPVSLLVEYSLLEPVVDDPGDFYSFSRSHLLMAGVRF